MKVASLAVSNRTKVIASLLVLFGAISLSTKAILVKLSYRYGIDTISLLALRMLFSLPFYITIGWYSSFKAKKEALAPIRWKDALQIIGLGLLGYYFASLFDFLGLRYITAGLERLILFIYPTLVVLISAIFLKMPMNRSQVIALILTYLGIGVAFAEFWVHPSAGNYLLGGLFVFGSAMVYAIYLIGSSSVIQKFGVWRFTSYAMIAASGAILLHHGVLHHWRLFIYPLPVYGLAFLMAILATVLPSFLVSEGLRSIGASNTSIISSISPIATVLMAKIFLDEQFGWLQWLGTLLVISGILLTTLKKNVN